MVKNSLGILLLSTLLLASQHSTYEEQAVLYKSGSEQLKDECTALIKGKDRLKPSLMMAIQNTFWLAKDSNTITEPINSKKLLEVSQKNDILLCKKALQDYKLSVKIDNEILKDLNITTYFFKSYIETLEKFHKLQKDN